VLVLPLAVRWVAYLLPTTYALDLLRVHAIASRPLLPIWAEWVGLVLMAAAMLWLGRLVFSRTERRLRIQGTLGQH
jgi:ABC-type multidrug transport system permease subunit